MFTYTIGELLSKHTRLKYGVDESNLLGEDPYYILRLQVAGMIDYIYIVSIYILVGIIIGVYILTRLKKRQVILTFRDTYTKSNILSIFNPQQNKVVNNSKMKTVYYQLYHIYESEDPEDDEITKFIGVFSSAKKAKEAIEYLRKKQGFKDFPKKNFMIYKANINIYGWQEGFCSWNDAYEYQKRNE